MFHCFCFTSEVFGTLGFFRFPSKSCRTGGKQANQSGENSDVSGDVLFRAAEQVSEGQKNEGVQGAALTMSDEVGVLLRRPSPAVNSWNRSSPGPPGPHRLDSSNKLETDDDFEEEVDVKQKKSLSETVRLLRSVPPEPFVIHVKFSV